MRKLTAACLMCMFLSASFAIWLGTRMPTSAPAHGRGCEPEPFLTSGRTPPTTAATAMWQMVWAAPMAHVAYTVTRTDAHCEAHTGRVTGGRGVPRVAVCLVGAVALLSDVASGANYDVVSHMVVAGTGSAAHTDGKGKAAAFTAPKGMAYVSGMLYTGDVTRVRRMNTTAYDVTTVAGSTAGTTNGPSSNAKFTQIFDLTVSSDGKALYATDHSVHTIRHITIATFVVATLTGTAKSAGTADGAAGTAKLQFPLGITAGGSNGNVYFSDTTSKRIRMATSVGVVSSLAGSTTNSGYMDGVGTTAQFNTIIYIAWYSDVIYVCDRGNNRVRKVWQNGTNWQADTLAGKNSGTAGSGVGEAAVILSPYGITAYSQIGAVYVSSSTQKVLWRIYVATATATMFNSNNSAPAYFALATDGVALYGASPTVYQIWKIELTIPPPSVPPPDSGTDVGLIVGVVVGCTVAVVGIGVVVFLLRGKIFKPATSTNNNG